MPTRILEGLLLLCLLAAAFPLAMALRTEQYPARDAKENLQIALNLQRYGVYSFREAMGDAPPAPTLKREPFYPVLLSLWIGVLRHEEGDLGSSTAGSLSADFLRRLKSLNVLLYLCLILASWWAARTFFASPWPALAVALLMAVNSSMLSTIDVFLTEIPGALLVVLASTLLYLSFTRKAAAYPLLGGLALGALALTKAIYFYFTFLLLLAAVLWLGIAALKGNRQWRPATARWAILALVALAAYSPWFLRNQRLGEVMQVDERGEDVLAIRAEYSTMSWKQYAASFFFFTPEIGPRLTGAIFGKQTRLSFDRSKPGSFFRKAINGTGEVQRRALERNISTRRASIQLMAENLPKMCLLTLPFAYRGAFMEVGFHVRRVPRVVLYFTMACSLLFLPAFIVLLVRVLKRRDRRWPFLVLALYSYLFHSLITHYIPRYSLPLIPIFVTALVGAIAELAGKRLKHETHRADPLPE